MPIAVIPTASPLQARLAGLPPAVVITAGFDPLCSEGDATRKPLPRAGVTTIHRNYEGADPRLPDHAQPRPSAAGPPAGLGRCVPLIGMRPCRHRRRSGKLAHCNPTMSEDTMANWDTIDRYVVISTDTHAGADIGDYKPYLPNGAARRLRRVGQDLRQPVRRPDHCDRQPKLGQRPADRRHGRRRRGCRGAAAQHRSAVLPDHPEHHHQPASHPRRVREALGGRASAQPLADRLLLVGPDPSPRTDSDLP